MWLSISARIVQWLCSVQDMNVHEMYTETEEKERERELLRHESCVVLVEKWLTENPFVPLARVMPYRPYTHSPTRYYSKCKSLFYENVVTIIGSVSVWCGCSLNWGKCPFISAVCVHISMFTAESALKTSLKVYKFPLHQLYSWDQILRGTE